MTRYFTAVCAASIAVAAILGNTDEASARCVGCGPVPPVYNYRTVDRVMHQTQYRDVQRPNYVHQTRFIYNVTQVRPIVQVHTVTRVHNYSVPVIHDVHVPSVQTLPPQYYYTNSVQNIDYGCGCQ